MAALLDGFHSASYEPLIESVEIELDPGSTYPNMRDTSLGDETPDMSLGGADVLRGLLETDGRAGGSFLVVLGCSHDAILTTSDRKDA